MFGCVWTIPPQAQHPSSPGEPGTYADTLPVGPVGGVPPREVVRVARTESPMTFSGSRAVGATRLHWSGGTVPLPGDDAAASGPRLTWIGWRDARGGVVQVYFDGVLAVEFVTHPGADAPIPFFSGTVLPEGRRTLLLEPGENSRCPRPPVKAPPVNLM